MSAAGSLRSTVSSADELGDEATTATAGVESLGSSLSGVVDNAAAASAGASQAASSSDELGDEAAVATASVDSLGSSLSGVVDNAAAASAGTQRAASSADELGDESATATAGVEALGSSLSGITDNAAAASAGAGRAASSIDELGDESSMAAVETTVLTASLGALSVSTTVSGLTGLVAGIASLGTTAAVTAGKIILLVGALGFLSGAIIGVLGVLGGLTAGLAGLVGGAGLAGGALAAAFGGGLLSDMEAAKERLEELKEEALDAIAPLQTFQDLSFGILDTAVDFLGDLAEMLASLEGPIESTAAAIGSVFEEVRPEIIDGLRNVISTFLPVVEDLATGALRALPGLLNWLATEGARAAQVFMDFLGVFSGLTTAFLSFGVELTRRTIPGLEAFVSAIESSLDAVNPQLINSLANSFNTLAPILGRFIGGGLEYLPTLLNIVSDELAKTIPLLGQLGDTFAPIINAVLRLVGALTRITLRGLITLGEILRPFAPLLTAAANAADAFSEALFNNLGGGAFAQIRSNVSGLSGLAGQLENAFQSVGNTIAQTFNALQPTFEQVQSSLRSVLPAVGEFVSALISAIPHVTRITAALLELAATIGGGALSALADLARSILPLLAAGLRVLAPLLTQAARAITTFVRNNRGLITTIAKVVTMVAAFYAIIQGGLAVIAGIGAAMGMLSAAIAGIGVIIGAISAPVLAVAAALTLLYFAWQNQAAIISTVRSAWSSLVTTARQVASGILQSFRRALTAVISFFTQLATRSLASLRGFVTRGVTVFNQLRSRIVTVVRGLVTRVIQFFTRLGTRIVARIQAFVTRVIGFFTRLSTQVINRVRNFATRVIQFFTRLQTQAIARLRILVTRAIVFFTRLRGRAIALVRMLVSRVIVFFTRLRTRAIALITRLVTRAIGLVNRLRTQAINRIRMMVNRVIGFFTRARNRVISIVTRLKDRVLGIVGNLASEIATRAQEAADNLIEPFQNAFDNLVGNSIVPDLADGVQKHIGRMADGMGSRVRDATSFVSSQFSRLSNMASTPSVGVDTSGVGQAAETANRRLGSITGRDVAIRARVSGPDSVSIRGKVARLDARGLFDQASAATSAVSSELGRLSNMAPTPSIGVDVSGATQALGSLRQQMSSLSGADLQSSGGLRNALNQQARNRGIVSPAAALDPNRGPGISGDRFVPSPSRGIQPTPAASPRSQAGIGSAPGAQSRTDNSTQISEGDTYITVEAADDPDETARKVRQEQQRKRRRTSSRH